MATGAEFNRMEAKMRLRRGDNMFGGYEGIINGACIWGVLPILSIENRRKR